MGATSAKELSTMLKSLGQKPRSKKKADLMDQLEELGLLQRPSRKEYMEEAKRQRRLTFLDFMLHGRPDKVESEYEKNLYDHLESSLGKGCGIPRSIFDEIPI